MTSTELAHYREPAPAVGERDLMMIEKQAAVLAKSDAAGPYKNKAADIVLVGLTALALDLPLVTTLPEMYVINSRVVPSAALRVGLAIRAGHEFWFEESTPQRATACLRRRGSRRIDRLTVDIADVPAGLKNKDTWKQYPAAMLRAMSSRQLVRAAAPDVVLGLPSVSLEEIDENPEDTFDFDDHAPELTAAPADVPVEYRPANNPDTLPADERARLIADLAALSPEELEQVNQLRLLPGTTDRYQTPNPKSTQFTRAHAALLSGWIKEVVEKRAPEGFDEAMDEAVAGTQTAYGPGEEPFEA